MYRNTSYFPEGRTTKLKALQKAWYAIDVVIIDGPEHIAGRRSRIGARVCSSVTNEEVADCMNKSIC